MAVAFDAVGPSAAGAGASGAPATSPLTWAHNPAAGAALLVGICLDFAFNGTVSIGAVTFGGVAMTSLGSVNVGGLNSGGMFLFGLTGVTGGSQTVSVAFTSGSGNPDVVCAGSISFTGAGSFGTFQSATGSTGTETKAFSTTSAASLVAGFCGTGGGTAMTTSAGTQRFTNNQGGGSGTVGNTAGSTAPGTGSNVTLTWAGNTTSTFGIAGVEVLPPAVAPTSAVALLPLKAPGWFPGSAAVTQDPGGIPFYSEPQPTDATPGVPIPVTPEAAAPRLPLLPPGWFPGADKATTEPGGIPFYSQPLPVIATPAVIFPVPEVAGIADWLPLPPNWFPGASAVTTDPGSIPFYSLPQPLTPPPAPPPVASITTLAGSGAGGYFADQFGTPRMWVGDEIWALLTNAGRWNSGNYQATFDAYFHTRGQQGYTICFSDMFGSAFIGGAGNGQMWDGTTPFTGGNPSTGLNDAYWSRIDYAIKAAAANGITVALSFGGHWDWDVSGNSMFGLTGTQYQDAGNAIGSRYKGVSNLIWLIMDDYFGSFDSSLTSLLTGLRASGDTHPIAIENYSETSSRFDLSNNTPLPWGTSNTQYNFGYSYSESYLCIEYMYAEASPLACIYGDGYFYQGGSTYAGGSGAGALDRAVRQEAWWAVTSGARGFDLGDEALWQWPSTAPAVVSTQWYAANNIGNIRALMESLPGWHTLAPATGSTLITAGRGTRGTQLASGGGGGQYEPATSNNYVSASRTPDTGSGSSLAVMYLPAATTITIDQTKIASGYTAYWVDPVTGVKTSTTTGATYNSTAQGSNSRGDPDWVLVLQGPAGGPSAGIASIAGAAAVTAVITQIAPATAAGAGAVTAVATVIAPAAAPGAAAVTDVVTQIATATAAGAAAVTAAGAQSGAATAAAAGAGSVTAVVTQIAPGAAAGAAAVTTTVTTAAGATAAGTGSAAAVASQIAPGTSAGAGAVTDVATQIATATAAAAGSVTASGASSGSATASAAGAAAVTAVVTQAATATAAGAGATADVVTQTAKAAAAAAGAVNASGVIPGTASATGAAAATAKAVQTVTASPAGAGVLTALATQAATAALAGTGSVTAVSGTQVAFTVGTLTASDRAAAVLGAAAATAPQSTLTATDTRTGGPT